MPDYKEMYLALFEKITKAIDLLQEAQQETEALFMETDTGKD